MCDIDLRTKTLLGDDFSKLQNKKVAVVGLGGVGSIIPLTLVRTGIKRLIIIDKDKVEYSNLNRQIAYDLDDVNEYKASALKKKLLKIRSNIEILEISKSIDVNFTFSIFDDCDFVVDCIDDIKAKVELTKYCVEHNINFVSSLGMGNRIDPSKIFITKLNKTIGCPLAKKFRYMLKKENVEISNINVAFSSEEPIIKNKVVSSVAFAPNAAGLNISSFVIKTLIGW